MTSDQTTTFKAALKEARSAFDRASERLADITYETYKLNDEISRLRSTITALAAMCSESPWNDSLGITESCTEIMETVTGEVSTQDVVEKLGRMGFDLKSQKNPAASVHAVLSRLAKREDGKIEKITDEVTGDVKWRGPQSNKYSDVGITDDDIPF